ncbi:hypothetical protein CcaverHIS002_0503810 [Cutaneotrichosporon cavernicola]|uniref:Uncharacterized protein n=1 Tax=Cutaneotrichosporon cavernicola TaxID=279322 RepID=A0AA48L6H1_9TREE|nr:uncharacterized protein CcaverHIS019_0504380 [Cutaneotrichosporon cavernicola]BEI84980.1 hypothetical protein CcaverHIS002_0503810 [Cutaneotrichosporon cavernicola]BEI92810.1 hypothetical protein CcaverHIS019_0504380 [Cutaneotrichosporon cavernicola]BEJ00586.1 hypothetical protein CcaverHIS631_0504430 [Cutaneotrichosporon cavernicola]BEJ08354.1 hypothetical protein CcaverHIS641_0504390 [Cutaneotrichosporon cavernicola]
MDLRFPIDYHPKRRQWEPFCAGDGKGSGWDRYCEAEKWTDSSGLLVCSVRRRHLMQVVIGWDGIDVYLVFRSK